jgi:NMD protein affecting ribosome stability and mRNA decay
MFCIKCGKKAEIGNFCKKCFLERTELFTIDNLSVTLCDCKRYLYNDKWYPYLSLEKLIKEIVSKNIKKNFKIIEEDIKMRKIGNGYKVRIVCKGRVNNLTKTEEKTITVTIKKRLCDNCTKLRGNYYEAVLQIRNEDILKKIIEMLGNKPYIINKVKNGYDIKLINKRDAKIIKQIKGITVIKSFKHVTRKKDKNIFREFYSVR